MTLRHLILLAFALGCSSSGKGQGECKANPECPAGQFCSELGVCDFECRKDVDCAGAGTCNSLGACVIRSVAAVPASEEEGGSAIRQRDNLQAEHTRDPLAVDSDQREDASAKETATLSWDEPLANPFEDDVGKRKRPRARRRRNEDRTLEKKREPCNWQNEVANPFADTPPCNE